ncbi:hypothetical protein [Bacteroides fragilis]|uniref:Uncharacterized protein n=1 Tax=Bacteroides fragilis TaxID=817 RepID=A0A5C6J3Z3_BACFG|nr:hypothetical protein [Bacteroides fragilis]KAB5385382.1 hypothetical protein F9Z90_25050 [Bacteroides fragilis]KAB5385725.1 hypothetical protein F9Z90_24970 [Bacteroides fragilis]TWV35552.1 hypothetical protein FSA06_25030 [Bacteroides fragilis]TWV35896.1 hypothetical protein FSA06_24950 [Bacteroides fragilis]TWV42649.1 hypothetical protein FSA03_25005 [Bacteroides fragilis]
MLKSLNFKKQGDAYISDPVQLTSDAGLHLEFPYSPAPSDIRLLQSMTGGGYVCFKEDKNFLGDSYDTAITGVIPGMFVKVCCSRYPVSCQILVSE